MIYTSAIATDLGAWVVLIIYAALGVALWAYAKAMQKRDPANWAPVELSPDTVAGRRSDKRICSVCRKRRQPFATASNRVRPGAMLRGVPCLK